MGKQIAQQHIPNPSRPLKPVKKLTPPTKSMTTNGPPLTTMPMPMGTLQQVIQLTEEVWPTGCTPPMTCTQAAKAYSHAIAQLEDEDN
jgi:hypothetical protein